MIITLDTDVPFGCLRIISEDGQDLLIQQDTDFPGVAATFVWDMRCVRHFPANGEPESCDHRRTDGTVNCPDCKVTASEFIGSAVAWLSENDGATAVDPGYFSPTEKELVPFHDPYPEQYRNKLRSMSHLQLIREADSVGAYIEDLNPQHDGFAESITKRLLKLKGIK